MSDKKIETRVLTPEEVTALGRKSRTSWRNQIIEYLTKDDGKNNGQDTLKIYDATRADRRDISDSKKKHNIASQITYLRDDGYFLKHEDSKLMIIANPKMEVFPGAEKWL